MVTLLIIVLGVLGTNIASGILIEHIRSEEKKLKLVKLETTIYFTVIVAYALFA